MMVPMLPDPSHPSGSNGIWALQMNVKVANEPIKRVLTRSRYHLVRIDLDTCHKWGPPKNDSWFSFRSLVQLYTKLKRVPKTVSLAQITQN